MAALVADFDTLSKSDQKKTMEAFTSLAVTGCELSLLHRYLDHKVPVNGTDDEGVTALMYACSGGHLSICELLLSRGADVNFADPTGVTALMGAAEGGFADILSLLLKHGADINLADQMGNLHFSSPRYLLIYSFISCKIE